MAYCIKYVQTLLAVLLVLFQFVYADPHTVQKGESMTQIAKLYGIPLDSLIGANPDSKQGEAILKMKEEGYDIIAERQKMIDENKAFEEELRKDERRKRLEMYKMMNSKDLGVSANSSVSVTTGSGSTYKPTASETNVKNDYEQLKRNNRKTDTQDKDMDAKQQFKIGQVSSDDYQFVRHIDLYVRTNNSNNIRFRDKDLCKKGGYYYVKIGNMYYKVMPNRSWGFNHSISVGGQALFFNM